MDALFVVNLSYTPNHKTLEGNMHISANDLSIIFFSFFWVNLMHKSL